MILRSVLRYLVSVLVLLLVWAAIVLVFRVPRFLLPPPWQVAQTLASDAPLLLHALGFTALNLLVGGGLGISLGFATGASLAYFPTARRVAEPYLTIFQSFPRESLFPLLVVWIGFGPQTKMVSSGLLAFFPMAVITLNSLLDIREDYLSLIRSWGATRFQEFAYCRLPAALPGIIGGLKVSAPLALIGAVLGEFMGGGGGLGYLIVSSGSSFRVDRIFAAIVVLALLGTAIIGSIQLLERGSLARYFQESHEK